MLKKGSLTIHDYFLKIRGIADTLSSIGQSISDDELLLYVLGGLGSEYDPMVVKISPQGKILLVFKKHISYCRVMKCIWISCKHP